MFHHFLCDMFAGVTSFSFDFRKNTTGSIFQPHSTSFDVFGILIGHQWVISMWISQKAKKGGSIMFTESVVQKSKGENEKLLRRYAYVSRK